METLFRSPPETPRTCALPTTVGGVRESASGELDWLVLQLTFVLGVANAEHAKKEIQNLLLKICLRLVRKTGGGYLGREGEFQSLCHR